MIDKRKDSRAKHSLAVTYLYAWDDLKISSQSIDISPGGIRLPVRRRLEPGTVLELEIHWHLFFDPIKITGKVAWVRERNSDHFPFELGVQFLEIHADDLETIRRICYDQSLELAYIEWLG